MKISSPSKIAYFTALNVILFAVSGAAHAQIGANATTLLTSISTWLRSIGVIIITIALMVVGFRMAFQAAEWKDVAPVFWGGVLIGGAAAIAALFVA